AIEQLGKKLLGAINVGLNFHERDRRPRQRAVSIDNGVTRVLPALIDEAPITVRGIFEITVAVDISVMLHPGEGPFDLAAQLMKRLQAAGQVGGASQKNQEEQRGVDRAVIGRVRDLAGTGQLADAKLVQDLAGLLVAPVIYLGALVTG